MLRFTQRELPTITHTETSSFPSRIQPEVSKAITATLLMKEYLIVWVFCALAGNSQTERPPLILEANFLSTNFVNIFTWINKEETPPGTVYFVQHKRYGEEWQDKSQCQNITQRFCNLTHETENFTERFHARVRATVPNCCTSEWVQSLRFCPREDTNIGNPEVKFVSSTQSLKFFIQPPYTPLKDEDNQTLTVVDIFSQFGDVTYEVMMFCQKTQQKWVKIETTQEFEISDLDPDTEYNGTVCIKYADKISKPYVFQVRTLPDLTWMPYLFVVILFVIILIFGTIYYLIVKYIKQYDTKQPKALQDFKDISRFHPLVPNAEHFLIPCSLSKSTQQTPEIQPAAQINSHLLGGLEHQKLVGLTETAYQQQARMSPSQTFPQPTTEAGTHPRGYAPQAVKNNPPSSHDNPLPLTYGLCVEGDKWINKAGSSPNQPSKIAPFTENSPNNGHYQAQKPEYKKQSLWAANKARQESVLMQEHAGEIPNLMLQEDAQLMSPQRLSTLGEKVPATTAESPGSYKKQPGNFFLELTQNASLDNNPLLASRPPLMPHYAHNHLCQDPTTKQWLGWDPSPWTHNQLGCHTTDSVTLVGKGLANEPEASGPTPGSPLDSAHNNGLFTDLFKDLELKIQWEQETDENALVC